MYSDHGRVCVSVCLTVCLSLAVCAHYCTDPDVTWGMVRVPSSCGLLDGFAIGEHDNIAPNAKCQQVFVLVLCLVDAVAKSACHGLPPQHLLNVC